MFNAFEYYLLLSWCYPCLAYPLHIYLNKKRINDKIFSIEDVSSYVKLQINTIRQVAPTYVGAPNALFPVGGGITSDYETVYTAFQSKSGVYWNYDYAKFGTSPEISNLTYVSNETALSKIIPENTHGRFPCVFPMKIIQSNLPNVRLYLHQETALVAYNAKTLLVQALFKTRPVGTLAIPGIAFGLFLGSYAFYAFKKYDCPILYKNDPQPTNILKKILNT